MARRVIAAIGGVSGILLLMSSQPAAQSGKAAPTYNREVAPIINRSCSECHRPEQVAPMSLLSYQEVRPWARAIKAKVVAREMPPWHADPKHGKFKNDRSLSQAEIDTISAWVDAGAPQGTGDAPKAPVFAGGWSHPSGRPPDLIIEFPIDLPVNANGEMPNFNLYTPLPFNEAKYVSATQVLPGSFTATHHITTAVVNMPPGTKLGRGPAWPGGPIVDYVPVEAERGASVDNTGDAAVVEDEDDGGGFGAYIPGAGTRVARPGQARLVRGDRFRYVRWNLHFQATGQPEKTRPQIGVWWEKDTSVRTLERSLSLREQTSEGKPLVADPRRPRNSGIASNVNPLLDPIPANASAWTLTGINGFQKDVLIQGITLHMHLRGKDVTYVLTYPDGREQILMRVPKYDFNWQFNYEFAEPIKAPAGSTVKAIARFDNSAANKLNPAPHKQVYWSEQSWDDMYLSSVRYIVDESASTARPSASAAGASATSNGQQ
jgi:hypothetical protein